MLESVEEEFIYFHSSDIEHANLVVEVIVKNNTENRLFGGGFTNFGLNDQVGKVPKAVTIQKGTPRQIVSSKNLESKGKAELEVEVFEVPECNCLSELVSQNTLVSLHENVPGLTGERIPRPQRTGTKFVLNKLKTVPFKDIYLHNLQMGV